ncbi:MAG TPA: MBL fold metallo-hydrolase [Myxococcota bacterium]|nr:MBL fold metallo-hydrolase [Myxococcota bacterium]
MNRVVLTGTGVPVPDPERAGAGTLVEVDGVRLQVDAGRGTVLRLAGSGTPLPSLDAVLLTHHHSDHLVALADLVLSRWLAGAHRTRIVAPAGPTARFAARVLDPWQDDIAVRIEHANHGGPPTVEVTAFEPAKQPVEVARFGTVAVTAVSVHHEPVLPAVAYKIEGPTGSVVVSGDTRVCAEVEALAAGVDVLVHEVRLRSFAESAKGTRFEAIAEYHADAVDLGAAAERARVRRLVLTHFIPLPRGGYKPFTDEVRKGGFTGELIAGDDLTTVSW